MIKKLSLLLTILINLSGCARMYHISVPFDQALFQKYSIDGTSKIIGQAFLKTRGGDVKYGAGNEIRLIPYNSYTHEIWQAEVQGYRGLDNKDPRLEQYFRITTADGMGNFEFTNIPEGAYLLSTQLYWEIPTRYYSYKTGSNLIRQVFVKEGDTRKVMLTE